MDMHTFLHQLRESYDCGRRFCFVLGAGASKSSGIKTGVELIDEWRKKLLKQYSADPRLIESIAHLVGIEDEDLSRILGPSYEIQSTDYFTFYDLMYPGDPLIAYTDLQKLMEGKEPSIGYYALAVILELTENKLAITTNFDSLIEDAVSLYSGKHALVVGHGSLASFIGSVQSEGRPTVAKVHGDLLLSPKNDRYTLNKRLEDNWRSALTVALARYTPIVIGYAGGDHTLMNLLGELKNLDVVYWCTMKKSDEQEEKHIAEFMKKERHRYLVPIEGFDDVMLNILDSLLAHEPIDSLYERIHFNHTERMKSILGSLIGVVSVNDGNEADARAAKHLSLDKKEENVTQLDSFIESFRSYMEGMSFFDKYRNLMIADGSNDNSRNKDAMNALVESVQCFQHANEKEKDTYFFIAYHVMCGILYYTESGLPNPTDTEETKFSKAIEEWDKVLELCSEDGDQNSVRKARSSIMVKYLFIRLAEFGEIEVSNGRSENAQMLWSRCLQMQEAMKDELDTEECSKALGDVKLGLGVLAVGWISEEDTDADDYENARELLDEAREIFNRLNLDFGGDYESSIENAKKYLNELQKLKHNSAVAGI